VRRALQRNQADFLAICDRDRRVRRPEVDADCHGATLGDHVSIY
jgi:hypothetical protein